MVHQQDMFLKLIIYTDTFTLYAMRLAKYDLLLPASSYQTRSLVLLNSNYDILQLFAN